MIQNHGINDMPRGWRLENEWNKKVYQTWHDMLTRCYNEKFHKRSPTYKNCYVCKRWLVLSNFIEDIKLIDGYSEEKFLNGDICLDKDIKSNGQNKEYSIENCIWVSHIENFKQAIKTRDDNYLQGKNNLRSIKICQYDKETYELIKIWGCIHDIKRELSIDSGSITKCCKWYECNEDLKEWFKIYKENPRKSAGGYIFKYYKESEVAKK